MAMETNRLIIVSVLLCLFLGASAKKKNQDYPRAEIKVSYNYHKKSMRSDGIVVERDVPFILLANKIQSKFYSDESKEVIGYQCFRAVTDYRGRKWTAWFAPEIPIQEGPWKLCGLPGLILEAYDNNGEYHFEADGLTQNPNSEIGIFTYDDRRGRTTVIRDKFFNNWWKYKHSNFGAKMTAAYGVGPKATPEDSKPRVVHGDNEETNYPHNL